jgi:hypothetical protein
MVLSIEQSCVTVSLAHLFFLMFRISMVLHFGHNSKALLLDLVSQLLMYLSTSFSYFYILPIQVMSCVFTQSPFHFCSQFLFSPLPFYRSYRSIHMTLLHKVSGVKMEVRYVTITDNILICPRLLSL